MTSVLCYVRQAALALAVAGIFHGALWGLAEARPLLDKPVEPAAAPAAQAGGAGVQTAARGDIQAQPLTTRKAPTAGDTEKSAAISRVLLRKWEVMAAKSWGLSASGEETCAARLGRTCSLDRWQAFLNAASELDAMRQIRAVNSYVNRVAYRSDNAAWGTADYWATPGEFFARGGDCEDFAIAKYMGLRALGVPAENMRIAVVRIKSRRIVHAVLIVKHGGREYMLDNLSRQVRPWNSASDYEAIYSLNESWAALETTRI